ncbi:hypothetical protein Q3G72_021373 [Acer saccharum]|nr:hypothetical protein Q3G72_021373 [Acer saccharum]
MCKKVKTKSSEGNRHLETDDVDGPYHHLMHISSQFFQQIAPAGNRTRVCTVAGYYSTTRPLGPVQSMFELHAPKFMDINGNGIEPDYRNIPVIATFSSTFSSITVLFLKIMLMKEKA